MYQRALRGYKKVLGAERMSTLAMVNNLGALYSDQGKLDQAEEMYQRALRGYEKALGAEHTSTLSMVNNLGLLYSDQGKLNQAEEMYQRALRGYEKALGAEHMSTLAMVNNLGTLYRNQGKLNQAEEMYQWALRGYEKALGAEHTSTLSMVNNLGTLYSDQGKLNQAEEMYQRALRGMYAAEGRHKAVVRKEHLRSVNNLILESPPIEQADQTPTDSGYASGTHGKSVQTHSSAGKDLEVIIEGAEYTNQDSGFVGSQSLADKHDVQNLGLYAAETIYSASETSTLPPPRDKGYITDLAAELLSTVKSYESGRETLERISEMLPDL
ncbi:hypothetical protein DV736_g6114, partial [Chaetothyriales sp. CBS 134916]